MDQCEAPVVLDLLELCLAECGTAAFFEELAELCGSALFAVEHWGDEKWQVRAIGHVVERFAKSCSSERLC